MFSNEISFKILGQHALSIKILGQTVYSIEMILDKYLVFEIHLRVPIHAHLCWYMFHLLISFRAK